MSNQLNKGDFALTLVSMPKMPAGSVVEILSFFREGETIRGVDGNVYQFGDDCWECSPPGSADQYLFSRTDLMPLTGGANPGGLLSREAKA